MFQIEACKGSRGFVNHVLSPGKVTRHDVTECAGFLFSLEDGALDALKYANAHVFHSEGTHVHDINSNMIEHVCHQISCKMKSCFTTAITISGNGRVKEVHLSY